MPDLYETDFVSWTRQQAAILLSLDPPPAGLDIEHLATEIEGVGRQAIRTLSLHLHQLLKNLILIYAAQSGDYRAKIVEQAIEVQTKAAVSVEPGIFSHLDLARQYRLARRSAGDVLRAMKLRAVEITPDCPFTSTELLAEDFNPVELARRFEGSRDD